MQLNFDRIRFIDSVFLLNATVCFSKNLWTDRAQERLFPASVQHARESVVHWPIPAPHYYMPEVMSVSGRKAFETWHAKQNGHV